MNALISGVMIAWFVPVRGGDAVVHLAPRTPMPPFGPAHGSRALCKAHGLVDRFARERWTRVRAPSRRHCQICFVAACEPERGVRVDWG